MELAPDEAHVLDGGARAHDAGRGSRAAARCSSSARASASRSTA